MHEFGSWNSQSTPLPYWPSQTFVTYMTELMCTLAQIVYSPTFTPLTNAATGHAACVTRAASTRHCIIVTKAKNVAMTAATALKCIQVNDLHTN
jgi:hypothetical protein